VVRFEARGKDRLRAISREIYDALARYPEVTIPALQV